MPTAENLALPSIGRETSLAASLTRALFSGIRRQDKRMAVFVAQSDESGSGDNIGVFLVGGCVSVETNWGPFADAWDQFVLQPPPRIPYLHMREIRSFAFKKKHKLTDVEAEEKIQSAVDLLGNIAERSHTGTPAMHGVLSIIKQSDLSDMVALVESRGHTIDKGTFDLPDYLCFLAYAQVVIDKTAQMFPDIEHVDFVVSAKGKIPDQYKIYLTGIKQRLERSDLVGELYPADPKTRIPLQIADVFCWHRRRHYQTGEVDNKMLRLLQMRTFVHEWARDDLLSFTESIIARLDRLDEKQH